MKYPIFRDTCLTIHDYRKKADLSHPIYKNTKKATDRIKFSTIVKLQPIISDGLKEYIASW